MSKSIIDWWKCGEVYESIADNKIHTFVFTVRMPNCDCRRLQVYFLYQPFNHLHKCIGFNLKLNCVGN